MDTVDYHTSPSTTIHGLRNRHWAKEISWLLTPGPVRNAQASESNLVSGDSKNSVFRAQAVRALLAPLKDRLIALTERAATRSVSHWTHGGMSAFGRSSVSYLRSLWPKQSAIDRFSNLPVRLLLAGSRRRWPCFVAFVISRGGQSLS